ncbi:hypothetical protein [Thalassomonas sp. RHCl1]|uniref:hypothetical protein n=1 Tax=Thalassomonas sp. RHCl1 TaxID=2995320 RepID=UPI00248BA393|nr:hypothetical protein [Thalassomonas sp. RHCl1]
MPDDILIKLKEERALVEKLLIEAKKSCEDAEIVLDALKPYFDKVDKMNQYRPIGSIKLERFMLESPLSNDMALFNCYGRFANLVEGLTV